MQSDSSTASMTMLAFVGMPGSGKSEAASYLKQKGYSYIRFGEVTEEGLSEMSLPLTAENEQMYREKIRQELGMEAFALKSEPKIQKALVTSGSLVIDGLYSWEEYLYLIKKFPYIKIIYVFAEPTVRYSRLAKRTTRPLTSEQARMRDIAEIEKLNKSGPIALADYLLVNNEDTLQVLHDAIDTFLERLHIQI